MNTPRAITGLLVFFVLGIIAINAVQAQTSNSTGTVTFSAEYYALTQNVPMISGLISNGYPVFRVGANIKEALLLTAEAPEDAGFIAITNEPYGVYLIVSDAPDVSESGQLLVYKYYANQSSTTSDFRSWDCGGFGSSETENIRPRVSAIDSITVNEFLTMFGCDSDVFYSPGPKRDSITQNISSIASAIKQKYAGQDVFVTANASTSVSTTPAPQGTTTPTTVNTSTVRACDIGNIIKVGNDDFKLTNGKYSMGTNGKPANHSDDPIAIVSDDERLPVTLIFKDGEKSAYAYTISAFTWEDDELVLQTQLCHNENGQWKEVWPNIAYASYSSSKDTFKTDMRSNSSSAIFTKEISNRSELPEVSVRFTGGNREKVTTYIYLKNDDHSIHAIALDAQKDVENIHYRFNFDQATYQLLTAEIPAYVNLSPDGLRNELQKIMQLNGTKNLVNNNYSGTGGNAISIQTAEGVLNNGGSFDNSYLKISNMMVSGEYRLTIAIPGYRPIVKTITVKSNDLSAQDPNRVFLDDIKYFSILSEDLKKDHCSACNDLLSCTLCADTMFVDKLTN